MAYLQVGNRVVATGWAATLIMCAIIVSPGVTLCLLVFGR